MPDSTMVAGTASIAVRLSENKASRSYWYFGSGITFR